MLLTVEQVIALRTRYYQIPNIGLRLGQFFLNSTPMILVDDDIYYEENDEDAFSKYVERYTVASAQEVADWIAAKDAEDAPKVDVQEVLRSIVEVKFHRMHTKTTCYLRTSSGFIADGFSDTFPERYNEAVGKKFAFDRALDALCQNHAYLVKFELHDCPPF